MDLPVSLLNANVMEELDIVVWVALLVCEKIQSHRFDRLERESDKRKKIFIVFFLSAVSRFSRERDIHNFCFYARTMMMILKILLVVS